MTKRNKRKIQNLLTLILSIHTRKRYKNTRLMKFMLVETNELIKEKMNENLTLEFLISDRFFLK